MTDPIQKLADIYPTLENGHKAKAREVKAAIEEMQARIADLESSLSRQPLPEAPASATVKVVDPGNQAEWLLTFRFHTEDELLAGVARISGKLPALGVVGFDAYVDGRRAERGTTGDRVQGLGSGNPQPQTLNPTPPLTFEAKLLTATVNDGKAYWKIKGGRFEKFGVTVWPETLEKAGFFVNELNVMESYNLTGWTATYTTKDGDKPDKVVGLTKAA